MLSKLALYATAMARSLISRLTSRIEGIRFGRPAGVTSMHECAADGRGTWQLAFPANVGARVDPRQIGLWKAELERELAPIPDLGILSCQGGAILGPHGWVFTADGQFVADASWRGATAAIADLPPTFQRPRRLVGVCLNLASDFALDNYGHFILDCLPRLALFLKAGFSLDDVDYVYLPRPMTKSASLILDALNIPNKKYIWANENPFVRADLVIATSFPGTKRNYARCVPEFLRGLFPTSSDPSRRIYIPREGLRRVRNEASLIDVASEFGVEVYDYREHLNEPEFFANVDFVVGPHGAGLANIAFCPPGAKVLELIPSDHVHPYYYTLSESARLDYSYILGRSLGARDVGAWGPSPFDFDVSVDEFRLGLSEILN
jgi:Glycosyltransferase 61